MVPRDSAHATGILRLSLPPFPGVPFPAMQTRVSSSPNTCRVRRCGLFKSRTGINGTRRRMEVMLTTNLDKKPGGKPWSIGPTSPLCLSKVESACRDVHPRVKQGLQRRDNAELFGTVSENADNF